MIDPKTLFPMVKKLLPSESDKDILAGMAQFAKAHPNLNNQQALQALLLAIRQMQGQKQPVQAAPQPFGQSLLSNLSQGVR